MTIQLPLAVPRPDHVPADRVVDFDMHKIAPQFAGEAHAYWKSLHETAPDIFWTPAYGGHWVMTRAEDIGYVMQTYELFSSSEPFIPRGVQPIIVPEQLDPPAHTPLRKLLMPAFLPKAVAELERKARTLAIELIEELKPRGECEFVGDFAGAMPILTFLTMLDLPAADAPQLRVWSRMNKEGPERAKEGWNQLEAYVDGWIERRRANPGDDLISRIVHGEVEGRKLTDFEVHSMCLLVVSGGLETVVTMTSFIARHLAENPEHRRRLREEPQIIPRAIEEFARRFGTSNLSREVRQDMEYKGLQLKKGDIILMPFPLYGLDERINEDPMRVDLDREQPQHVAFGAGVHTCPGAVLARREITIFLQEWLPRIPDFRVKAGAKPAITTGIVNSVGELWLEWDV